MPRRIIVAMKDTEIDPLGRSLERTIGKFLGIKTGSVRTRRVYIINYDLEEEEISALEKNLFVDPVTEKSVRDMDDDFDWLIEVGYKPGVTNPVSRTATKAASQVLGKGLDGNGAVATTTQYLLSGISKEQASDIANGLLANQTIESASIFSGKEVKAHGIPMIQYQITGKENAKVGAYDLNVSDRELIELSRNGVLALNLEEMRVIQKYSNEKKFKSDRKRIGMEERFLDKLTDVELEVIAQTQSEHCRHKIFNGMITYYDENGKKEVIDSLFSTCIRKPSLKLAEQYGWVLSAFHDNAGIVDMGNGIAIADKLETHNAPSALEPYGGAITGILGVNRDVLGAGIGAKPLFNVFGYCFGNPFHEGEHKGVLHPARIRNGVHKGVIDGGNQSGIPLAYGSEFFDDRFGYRPLVYCGTIGIMPKIVNGRPSSEKKAEPGDLIVMVGGRIGKDGIHGATFSSSALDKSSPVQAVQIGDSITQKRVSDFLMEARDLGLYKSITDNGAGGLSSSVGEMGRETNGFRLDLKKAPLKYLGLAPFEILISESQERMTLAVDPSRAKEFLGLAERRDVEATVLGEFENTGKFHVVYGDKTVAYLDMDFLYEGFPKMELIARWSQVKHYEPAFEEPKDIGKVLEEMLARLNICSREYKVRQYDHEVKGRSIIKPFVGKDCDVAADATVLLLQLGRKEGIVVAHGINPLYSDIDTYHMAASAIDEALRRIIAVGGGLPGKDAVVYGLDNFCWNLSSLDSADGEYKLAQLVRANKALADYCNAFGIPCISGKDSMKNVWKLEENVNGKRSERIISIPPTLLFSARARIQDVGKAVTMDVKSAGDLVYIVGETHDELGASEYFAHVGQKAVKEAYIGNIAPKVNAEKARKIYEAMSKITSNEIASSIHTPTLGGLGVALAQSAFAGGYGIEIDLRKVPYEGKGRDDYILFSQSNSRFVVTVPKSKEREFEKLMEKNAFAKIGTTTKEARMKVYGINGKCIIDADLNSLKSAWKRTLNGI